MRVLWILWDRYYLSPFSGNYGTVPFVLKTA